MTGIEEVAAGVAIVGAGVSIYGQISGANAEADARKEKAALDEQQAAELESREAFNEIQIRDSSRINQLNFGSRAAGSGSEGVGLGGQLEIQRQTDLTLQVSQRDAAFKARMIRSGAAIETQLASDAQTAGYISAAGTLLTSAAKGYSLYRGASSTPTKLPTFTRDNPSGL